MVNFVKLSYHLHSYFTHVGEASDTIATPPRYKTVCNIGKWESDIDYKSSTDSLSKYIYIYIISATHPSRLIAHVAGVGRLRADTCCARKPSQYINQYSIQKHLMLTSVARLLTTYKHILWWKRCHHIPSSVCNADTCLATGFSEQVWGEKAQQTCLPAASKNMLGQPTSKHKYTVR